MPDLNSRSPCPPNRFLSLQENAQPRTESGVSLREVRSPDRAHLQVRQEARGDTAVTLLDITVATAGKVNRNGRLYSREVWASAVAAAQAAIPTGNLWGLLEHPEDGWDRWDPLKGRLASICVRYETLTMDGDVVKATAVIVDTAAGHDLRALIEGGIAVAVSSNGLATAKYFPASEVAPEWPDPEAYIAVIQDDFRLLTIDMVSDPGDASGSARKKEQAHRPLTTPKEGTMHKHLKTLMEKFAGKSIEQIKADHPTEYTEALEKIAQESVQAPAPAPAAQTEPGTVSLSDYRALETTVVALNQTVKNLTDQNHNATRDGIAITALEAARLPSAGKVKNGETEIDLDASFRAELIGISRQAESDEAARSAVELKIVDRRAVLGQRPTEGKKPGVNGVSLPIGDNSRSKTESEQKQDGHTTRQLEQIRSRAGLPY